MSLNLKLLSIFIFFLLVSSCTENETDFNYPNNTDPIVKTSNDLKVTAIVQTPNNLSPTYRVKLQWETTSADFDNISNWNIYRKKGCYPNQLVNSKDDKYVKDYIFQFYQNSDEYRTHAFLDDTKFEDNTCYTYEISAVGQNVTRGSVVLAVPIGNAGFYR